jgi:ATP-dependent DNA helicase RecG
MQINYIEALYHCAVAEVELERACGLWRKDNQTGKEGYTLATALLFGKENTVLNCCPAYKTDAIYRNVTYERFLNHLPRYK